MQQKQEILQKYKQFVQDKIDVFQDMILALTEDSKNDAKGSAGDKHETALSMMHLEQEKLNYKLAEILQQKAVLDRIDATTNHQVVTIGSLVQTNHLQVFISTALPKIMFDNQPIFAISPESPLGNLLIGRKVGFEFEINGKNYTLLEIK